ncbi:MAG TPA: DNA-formamidopyrimidine glycosylase family protein [Vicinamibacteria bacterium]|nr:DNA-formamidopyrimidine glycosylase family protein [Vicinamibacteria bacterium]
MPEGDMLWRVANRLSPALVGRRVTALRLTAPALASEARRHHVEGSTIVAVEARGKHLLVRFSTGVALHTHLGMAGSWHLYRAGSRWRSPAHLARVVLEADGVVAVCFVPRVVELVPEKDEGAHPTLAALGPDVVADGFDAAAAVARLRARGPVPIGVALLDQTALSGIGNIYKSEVLFLCGTDPFTPVASLDAERLRRIVDTAHEQMRRRVVTPSGPATDGGGRGRYWVYGRARRPCRRCATLIRAARQGTPSRTTYWCPRCQAPGASG